MYEDKKNTCGSCKHFRQHYIKFGRSYRPLLYGHCTYPRLKNREVQAPACKHYAKRPSDKNE